MSEEDIRGEYEEMKKRFREMSYSEFQTGDWFVAFVQWVLSSHASRVDAEYLRRNYPGASSKDQAKKARQIAARCASVAGGISASVVTACELSVPATWGAGAPIAIPAIGTAIICDVAYTARLQLRTAYELSVLHQAPLALDDVEDCLQILALALGIRFWELAGDLFKTVGPKIVAFNVRRLLRSGVRAAVQSMLARVTGTQIAKKLTERSLMRLLVPGISIPISAGLNYWFTNAILAVADRTMRRRGACVLPLVRTFSASPRFPRDLFLKVLISLMEAPDREGWTMDQLNTLRHTQSALNFTDAEVAALEAWLDRGVEDLLPLLDGVDQQVGPMIIQFLIGAAALDDGAQNDATYAQVIATVAGKLDTPFDHGRIAKLRSELA